MTFIVKIRAWGGTVVVPKMPIPNVVLAGWLTPKIPSGNIFG